jgi:hypothetical protein
MGNWKHDRQRFYLLKVIIWFLLPGELLHLDFQGDFTIPEGCGGPLGFHCSFMLKWWMIMKKIAIETVIKLYAFAYIYTNRI